MATLSDQLKVLNDQLTVKMQPLQDRLAVLNGEVADIHAVLDKLDIQQQKLSIAFNAVSDIEADSATLGSTP